MVELVEWGGLTHCARHNLVHDIASTVYRFCLLL